MRPTTRSTDSETRDTAPTSTPIPEQIDLLLTARWIAPVEPARTLLENHSVAIRNGKIVAILPAAEAAIRFAAAENISLDEHILIPGLINLHTHAAMNLMRGYADDLPLMRWLQEAIWPAEAKHVSAEFVRDGTLLAAMEMLRSGITCFNDMYFYPGAAAEAVKEAGIRATLGVTVLDFPSNYAHDADDYLHKGLAVRDTYKDDPLVNFALAPHAPYTVSNKTFEKIGVLAAQLNIPIHTHLHETAQEINDSLNEHGQRPIARLNNLGLLSPELIAVHAVHLTASDIELLATHGCHIAHCPTSNMKLASGAAPIAQAMASGINVGLGTDGAASNNRLDLLSEMRLASLLGKMVANTADVLDSHNILEMATLNAARALNLHEQIGSLAPGKQADICAIRLGDWISQPCYDPVSHLVYVAERAQIDHVWVAGKAQIRHGKPVCIDPSKLLTLSRLWQNRLSS